MGTSAGKLAFSESSEAADEKEDPVSLEGNVQDHVKALKIRIRQFEAGSMTVCEDLMVERKKAVERNTIVECCSCGREPSERRTRKSQTLG